MTTTTTTTGPRTGRRKEAVARVRLTPGPGKLTVNGRTPLEYLKRETLVMTALHAFNVTNTVGKYNLDARVQGKLLRCRGAGLQDRALRGGGGQARQLRDVRQRLSRLHATERQRGVPGRYDVHVLLPRREL